MPDVLYEEIVEVKERVVFKQQKCQLNKGGMTVRGKTNEEVNSSWKSLMTLSWSSMF